ncbi:hypothetical protein [Achromobacter deleyi]|uniref:hypothetical protein n=1 Tax=Achromobacter deleyi TaxID=1353891 RepID=UPI0014916316|nr:hypothetical protein [Achromobacter deleyi]QVQ26800.1 hypothetical protein HLG70_28970 [Achromobacter deleyi]UIP22373.1 hypothetical protein LYZ39_07645 [Achromobacter deleyi]
MSDQCKCSFTIRMTGDGCRYCQPQTYIDTLEMCANDNVEMIERLGSRATGLEAARTAYASEFPADENGDPDVGSIHANIRKLKGEAAECQKALAALVAECARANAQAAREVQRTFIYPNVLEDARRALAAGTREGQAC